MTFAITRDALVVKAVAYAQTVLDKYHTGITARPEDFAGESTEYLQTLVEGFEKAAAGK